MMLQPPGHVLLSGFNGRLKFFARFDAFPNPAITSDQISPGCRVSFLDARADTMFKFESLPLFSIFGQKDCASKNASTVSKRLAYRKGAGHDKRTSVYFY